MTAGGAEKALERLVPDPSVRGLEPALDEGAELARGIIPISTRFALRQNGSFLSLKIVSRTWRLLPR